MEGNEPELTPDDPSDPFEWRSLDGTDAGSQEATGTRGIARPAIGTVFVAILAILLIGVVPQGAVAHTSFTAEEVSLTTNSGRLTSLTVAPEGDVHYNGLEAEPSSVEIEVSARQSGTSTWEPVTSKSISAAGLQGTVNYSIAEVSLLTATSMTSSGFAAADGETESTDVDVQVEVTLGGAGPGGGDVTATSMDTLTVTVTNEAAGAGVGGRANSDGRGA